MNYLRKPPCFTGVPRGGRKVADCLLAQWVSVPVASGDVPKVAIAPPMGRVVSKNSDKS